VSFILTVPETVGKNRFAGFFIVWCSINKFNQSLINFYKKNQKARIIFIFPAFFFFIYYPLLTGCLEFVLFSITISYPPALLELVIRPVKDLLRQCLWSL